MLRKEKNGIHWLEFEIFQGLPLKHALFMRHGGKSRSPFNSFNFSVVVGDNRLDVQENIDSAMKILCADELGRCRMVHGKKIDRLFEVSQTIDNEADGITTAKKGLALMTTFADCQCALIYDPINQVVGNIHAGWRGCVQNIYEEGVLHMEREYGSKSKDLLVGIGPSLGPNKAEFIHFERELPRDFLRFRLGEYHFDFWAIARDQFEKAGVLPKNIEVAKICTYENDKDFFSFRRDKICGRHAGFVMLN